MKNKVKQKIYLVDATGKVLGRLSTKVANILRGKDKADYLPNRDDLGDNVVVINAKDVKLTGNKIEKKIYYHYSGYPGGLRERTAKEYMEKDPSEIIRKAVYGMLPKNKLRDKFIKKLSVFSGDEYQVKGDEIELEI